MLIGKPTLHVVKCPANMFSFENNGLCLTSKDKSENEFMLVGEISNWLSSHLNSLRAKMTAVSMRMAFTIGVIDP
jgi:hypothetical protein